MGRVRLVIDTDGVTDDVRALSLALQHPDAEVVAITTVSGCVKVEQTVANVARTLRANGIDNVPIYKGAREPLIGNLHDLEKESVFFGSDGLGDAPAEYPAAEPADRDASVPGVHAAVALTQLLRENDDLTVVCIGPLTNLALAIKLDPDISNRPKQLVIMGGNVYGKGNVSSNSTAEFNFSNDPEAAHIVVREMRCPMTVVPWETFLHAGRESDVDFHAHLELDAPLSRFFEMATRLGRGVLKACERQFSYCDEVALGVAIEPENLIVRDQHIRAVVELHGEYTRGQFAIDWTEGMWTEAEDNPKVRRMRHQIRFVVEYNVHHLDKMIFDTIRRAQEREQTH